MTSPPVRLIGIQYLRGIAALMVVAYHLYPQMKRVGYQGDWPVGLSGGVDIFFVISGVIMWVTTCDRSGGTVRFWQRRLARIVPLYWLLTAVMVTLLLVTPSLAHSSAFDPWHMIASFLFLPALHPVKQVMEPVVMPGWTLNYEMLFYLIFGLTLPMPPRYRLVGTIGMLALMVCAGSVLHPAPNSTAAFYSSSILLEFAAGLLLGAALTSGRAIARLGPASGWLLVIAGLAPMFLWQPSPAEPRFVALGLYAAAAVLGLLVIEANGHLGDLAPLRRLGDASYALYLTQIFTLSGACRLWLAAHLDRLPASLSLFAAFALAACIATGWLAHRFVEQPLARLFRRRHRMEALRPVATGAA